ncbi:hypothetical protein PUN28_013178 [Cardiocondyla obscurior]|uniref:Uncharacterized protein n=1 Tax=Cardiocondyla obscurior TaxID=286306 RepID=A0AAW2FCC9_9HYME
MHVRNHRNEARTFAVRRLDFSVPASWLTALVNQFFKRFYGHIKKKEIKGQDRNGENMASRFTAPPKRGTLERTDSREHICDSPTKMLVCCSFDENLSLDIYLKQKNYILLEPGFSQRTVCRQRTTAIVTGPSRKSAYKTRVKQLKNVPPARRFFSPFRLSALAGARQTNAA